MPLYTVPSGDAWVYAHQTERAQLVFLVLPIMLPQLAAPAVKHGASDAVAPLTPVEVGQRAPVLRLVVNIGQRVHCLVDAAIFCNCLSQPCRPVSDLECPLI